MDKDSLIVDGFVFLSEKEAKIALNEKKNIEIIRQRTSLSDSETVYGLYTKLIESAMFKTVVGYSFLYELRYLLITDFDYGEEELPVVKLSEKMQYDKVNGKAQSILEAELQRVSLVKKKMTITIVLLIGMVVAMFVIAAINPNTGYINTENKILNKYATWQEELEQREQAVKEKEKALNMNQEK